MDQTYQTSITRGTEVTGRTSRTNQMVRLGRWGGVDTVGESGTGPDAD